MIWKKLLKLEVTLKLHNLVLHQPLEAFKIERDWNKKLNCGDFFSEGELKRPYVAGRTLVRRGSRGF